MSENTNDYIEILNHEHHVSKTHTPMSMRNRAAQFSPFAALTGYDEAVDETARLTDSRRKLTETELDALNAAFRMLEEKGSEHPFITVTYFQPDKLKSGGKYVTETGKFRVLDMGVQMMKFTDEREIPISEIIEVVFADY